ncbi:hypothetical protein ACHAXN_004070 [Cyclotella atomus]
MMFNAKMTARNGLFSLAGAMPMFKFNYYRLLLSCDHNVIPKVIKAINARTRPENVHVTLIDIQSNASYSGMVPGCVANLYTFDQVQIDLEALAQWAGTEFICGKVVGMTLPLADELSSSSQKLIQVEVTNCHKEAVTTIDIPFDVVSIDIGSTTRDFETVPGASAHCISTRPISDLIRKIELEEIKLKEKLSKNRALDHIEVVVVGGGAAGIELSLAMRARLGHLLAEYANNSDDSTTHQLSITLLDSNAVLMPGESIACQTALAKIMHKYDIEVKHNVVVGRVDSTHVHVKSEGDIIGKVPYTYCIWATGAQAHELSWRLNEQFDLAISNGRGWILVNEYLQSVSHSYIFAAGDCCEMSGEKRIPKAGVYAVRSGPILIQNLMQQLLNCTTNMVQYEPQDDFLKLLMCGDGTALGFRFGVPLIQQFLLQYGMWVWQLKNHIDLMFMDLFNVNKLVMAANKEGNQSQGKYDTSQYDGYEERHAKLNATEAAALLMRTDDEVNYQAAWDVLRDMIASDDYKNEVLSFITPRL